MVNKSISNFHRLFGICTFLMMACIISFSSCSGNNAKTDEAATEESTTAADDEAFYATQPLHSGLYDADYYDITGLNARKGKFDGRVYFSLNPKISAIYVFENGNRTKIDCLVGLKQPFEKGENGIYSAIDIKDQPVTLDTDSSSYLLTFQHYNDTVQIGFSPKPRHTGTAIEILEKINAQKKQEIRKIRTLKNKK